MFQNWSSVMKEILVGTGCVLWFMAVRAGCGIPLMPQSARHERGTHDWATRQRLLPDDRRGVFGNVRVCRGDREAFFGGLRHLDAVERVAVMVRQRFSAEDVSVLKFQNLYARRLKLLQDESDGGSD
jgi:hypothetical protein